MEAPVALTRLLPDTVLRADDVRIARVRTSALQNEVARSVDQIVGMLLHRPVAAGQPLRLTDLTRPPLVQRGSTVQIELSSPGLVVSGQAIALDAGAEGDKIRVQNMTSHAFLFAQGCRTRTGAGNAGCARCAADGAGPVRSEPGVAMKR